LTPLQGHFPVIRPLLACTFAEYGKPFKFAPLLSAVDTGVNQLSFYGID